MAKGSIEISDCRMGDIAEIAAIERDSFSGFWPERLFLEEMANPVSRILVARVVSEDAKRIAGYIVYWLVADELHLQKIAIRRDMRRQGIASLLLREAIKSSSINKTQKATLEVRVSNIPALKLYEKLGFSVKGVRPRYYDDTMEDALIMWNDFNDCLLSE